MSEPLQPHAVSKDDRTLAMLSHLLSFVEGGIIGPAILYFWKREESEFVAFHSLQSLLWGLLFVGVMMPVGVLSMILVMIPILGWLLLIPVLLGPVVIYLGFEIAAGLAAQEGRWYRLPLVGDLALQTHHP